MRSAAASGRPIMSSSAPTMAGAAGARTRRFASVELSDRGAPYAHQALVLTATRAVWCECEAASHRQGCGRVTRHLLRHDGVPVAVRDVREVVLHERTDIGDRGRPAASLCA